MKLTKELIKKLPKADLHVHLDGSLRVPTLIELAKKKKITLPSYTEEGLRTLVFKKKYKSLMEYLHGFQYTCAVMQDKESLERVAYEFALDCYADGVYYVEPRFAPQLHVNPAQTMEEVFVAVAKGLDRAKKEINKKIKGDEPTFEFGIIACAMRMFNEHFSYYYRTLSEALGYSSQEEMFAAASMQLAKACVKVRDTKGVPIVGFDLAGAERGFPAERHKEAYAYVHRNFMKKTVHAGEAYGPPSIFQAITDCYADRIGHGTLIYNADMVDLPTEEDRQNYVSKLLQFVADKRITIEICLTSNMQTSPELGDIKKHPVRKMLNDKLSVAFCTDNMLVSNTTMTNEIMLAVDNLDLTPDELRNTIIYSFKRSFMPSSSYMEKRKYAKKVVNYFERLISSSTNARK